MELVRLLHSLIFPVFPLKQQAQISAPKAIKEGAKKEEAEEIKAKLEAAGATIELK